MIPRRRPGPEPLAVAIAPDGDGSLAHGVVVDTRIVARLFRVPILRLEGRVVLSPSRFVPLDQPHVTVVQPDHSMPSPASSAGPRQGARIGVQLLEVSTTLARLRTGQGARPGPG